ncbi:hypothetical protein [Parendozoicomonas haliclonae]|uniref:Prephenate dehydrogenase n=1 Tax=Parendozoicomonas haliclonae TaxID=1960125 RepID=A0A1X7AFH7_9GAMM|nr:hypothetical protein [Parendozoicomonas haliclonae]SMA37693.1 hypothetical protein EHSB41UT_00774 [Parendozoicomonas haliclonae]
MSEMTEAGISQATRQAVVDKLTDNMKQLYPLAQRADEELEMLKKQNKGKFSAIFQTGSPFAAESDRFLPYMVEAANELTALLKIDDEDFKPQLQELMQKIQLLHQVLQKFHAVTDEEAAQASSN